jgi:hypothetical protein
MFPQLVRRSTRFSRRLDAVTTLQPPPRLRVRHQLFHALPRHPPPPPRRRQLLLRHLIRLRRHGRDCGLQAGGRTTHLSSKRSRCPRIDEPKLLRQRRQTHQSRMLLLCRRHLHLQLLLLLLPRIRRSVRVLRHPRHRSRRSSRIRHRHRHRDTVQLQLRRRPRAHSRSAQPSRSRLVTMST